MQNFRHPLIQLHIVLKTFKIFDSMFDANAQINGASLTCFRPGGTRETCFGSSTENTYVVHDYMYYPYT